MTTTGTNPDRRAVIRALNDDLADGGTFHPPPNANGHLRDFRCECSNDDCLETVTLSLDEYAAIRKLPVLFPVNREHADPTRERVVEAHAQYMIVKGGAETAFGTASPEPAPR